MEPYWKKPENVKFPPSFITFFGKKYGDEEPLEYSIQVITEDLVEDAITHMTRYFLVRENTCYAEGFIEDKMSVFELQSIWRHYLKQGVGLVALVNNEKGKKKIAGVNMTAVIHKSDKDNKNDFEGVSVKKILRCLNDLEVGLNVFDEYKTDIYLSALGLSVAPQYQGDNVGYQLLMARTPLCQLIGVPLTVTAFTGAASQYIASKSGFKIILSEINYESYRQDGKIAYPRLKGKVTLQAKLINEDTDKNSIKT